MDGNRIRDAIARAARTQSSVAAEIGLAPHKLSKSLAGTRAFKPAEIAALADALGFSTEYLLTGRGDDGGHPDSPLPERRILDSAAQLIATRGFHMVRIADIAKACDVSTGTVHYYFPTRDDVLTAALQHYAERMFVRVRARLDQLRDDPTAQLHHLIDSQLPVDPVVRDEWSVWIQFWTEAILVPALRPAHNDLYERWRSLIHTVVVNAQHAGAIGDRDPGMIAARFTSLVDGAATQLLTGTPGMNVELMRALLTEVFWPPYEAAR
ncbi:TetR/AcrR family transcriptional regulator [Streptomyces endophyticus]|uniref:TetR family transcriptional regulator C-terminal domain-containing protein n=1 Tax=Streptomyces endophyticus TaxID=714166 RepID=A0ABU6EYU7_9ACTN|nr:TetR/AcrR family transcriptional regulator [Streptomyces endophyticus]MEB8336877.1 TetR family transcriptional regulator C-terminal domain-containing protein [Streptomyces endophyticus]